MPLSSLPLLPLYALLLQTPAFTRSEVLTIIALGLGAIYFIGNRVNAVRDRKQAKQEAVREQAIRERTEKIKKLDGFQAEQLTKNTGFQQQIEHLNDELARALTKLGQVDEISRDNKQKIENVKESLARIEAQLATLLGSLLNRP